MVLRNQGSLLQRGVSTVVLLLASSVSLAAAPLPASAPAPTGQLKIEGTDIESLTLERERTSHQFNPDDRVILRNPGSTVTLPVGRYRLRFVVLQGGYECEVPLQVIGSTGNVLREAEWLTISAEKPCSLKVGAPLKQTVFAIRRGQTILLNYQVVDVDGQRYRSRNRGSPPRFTIYCRDRVVGSGSFEYG